MDRREGKERSLMADTDYLDDLKAKGLILGYHPTEKAYWVRSDEPREYKFLIVASDRDPAVRRTIRADVAAATGVHEDDITVTSPAFTKHNHAGRLQRFKTIVDVAQALDAVPVIISVDGAEVAISLMYRGELDDRWSAEASCGGADVAKRVMAEIMEDAQAGSNQADAKVAEPFARWFYQLGRVIDSKPI
jgi:hypothetical protein